MKAAYSLGYMGGSNELGKLYAHPTATITRQEAMVILARTMQADTGSSVDLDKVLRQRQNRRLGEGQFSAHGVRRDHLRLQRQAEPDGDEVARLGARKSVRSNPAYGVRLLMISRIA